MEDIKIRDILASPHSQGAVWRLSFRSRFSLRLRSRLMWRRLGLWDRGSVSDGPSQVELYTCLYGCKRDERQKSLCEQHRECEKVYDCVWFSMWIFTIVHLHTFMSTWLKLEHECARWATCMSECLRTQSRHWLSVYTWAAVSDWVSVSAVRVCVFGSWLCSSCVWLDNEVQVLLRLL